MAVAADVLFRAWTSEWFDRWFAAPGTVLMKPEVNVPYFFESHFEGERHPHHGRFLELDPGRLVKMTWLTAAGTEGVETVVTVEFIDGDAGTIVRLTHEGLPNERCLDGLEQAWGMGLENLEKALSSTA